MNRTDRWELSRCRSICERRAHSRAHPSCKQETPQPTGQSRRGKIAYCRGDGPRKGWRRPIREVQPSDSKDIGQAAKSRTMHGTIVRTSEGISIYSRSIRQSDHRGTLGTRFVAEWLLTCETIHVIVIPRFIGRYHFGGRPIYTRRQDGDQ
jgi:hypothetical protein